MSADFDSPWKDALEIFFRSLIELCFPRIAEAIDWASPVEFLDTELHEILMGLAAGRLHVDKLARVRLRSGEAQIILLHVEVQHHPQSNFAERLYSYHIRLSQRAEPVVTAAILADAQPNWRPHRYERELLGCRVVFDFPVCKLQDLLSDREALERSRSPAAFLVLANWAAQTTAADDRERFAWKLRLMRGLYRVEFSRNEIVELYRFLDWLLQLPEALEHDFREEIIRTEEKSMPYVTSIERFAIEKGREEGREEGMEKGIEKGHLQAMRETIMDVLLVRFGSVPANVGPHVESIANLDQLKSLQRLAVTCPSLAEFTRTLAANPPADS